MSFALVMIAALVLLSLGFSRANAAESLDRSLDAGPGWLIAESSDLDDAAYLAKVEELLAVDVVQKAVEIRRRLYRDLYLTPNDDRSKVVFLRGEPTSTLEVDCGFVFKSMEIWQYGENDAALVFYQGDEGSFRLWLPTDGKPMLYSYEMRYYMEQWDEFKQFIKGKRFDKRTCEAWKQIDEATGVDGLFKPRKVRPTDQQILAMVAPPSDPVAWTATVFPDSGEDPTLALSSTTLSDVSFQLFFPKLTRQRMETLFIVDATDLSQIEPTAEAPSDDGDPQRVPVDGTWTGEVHSSTQTATMSEFREFESSEERGAIDPELRLVVEGILEQGEEAFDRFRLRFRLPLDELEDPEEGIHVAFSEALRPGTELTARLRVTDPTSGRKVYLEQSFEVPRLPVKPPKGIGDSGLQAETGLEHVMREKALSRTILYLVPPVEDVLFGVFDTEAVVVGPVAKVVFSVDDKPQLTRTKPPFAAELRLADIPRQQRVRAEALDADGVVVASDELVINQPRGVFSVKIVDPRPNQEITPGVATVRVEVTLPPERRIDRLEFALDDQTIATLTAPPWETYFTAPAKGVVAYLAATATLTTGARVEDVRFLNAPELLERVDVKLVELLTTVTDSSGRPAQGFAAEDFEVYDNGNLQQLEKFEEVRDSPLVVGFAIDTSSSMKNALPEAKRAVLGFLDSAIRPQDRVFTIAFSGTAKVLTPPTDDFDLARQSLNSLISYGGTALNDALVTSLFFARGFEGRKVLVLLSDGEDTASRIDFETAMGYAQASGTSVYTIGLAIAKGSFRRQLAQLAEKTGGLAFEISKAKELEGVYESIAEELRNQVLLAYAPSPPGELGSFHEVEVKVRKRGHRARTIGGYIY